MDLPRDLNKFDNELLVLMEKDPENFESFQIEYKIQFDGNANELRRDIIAFANGKEVGYIFFGIEDDPIRLVGIEKNQIDGLKTVINDTIPKRIDPILSPFPHLKPILLRNKKYVLVVKIFPKDTGIYGIRKGDNPSKPEFLLYEFWTRMDGSKARLKVENVIDLILEKGGRSKKTMDIQIHPMAISPTFRDPQISITAINKSERPIKILEYGIYWEDMKWKLLISPSNWSTFPGVIGNTELPITLGDGEDCNAYYSRKDFEKQSEKKGYEFPIKLKAYFRTNDGYFYSELIEIDKLTF